MVNKQLVGYAGLWLALAAAPPARADPFFLRYDADETYPEQEGWERHSTDPYGVVVRSVADGVFRIDSSGSRYATDWYAREVEAFPVNPGEQLHLTWRMQVFYSDTSDGDSDINVAVTNGEAQFVQMFLARDYVGVNEDGPSGLEHLYEFEPGWHTFHFTTPDMLKYDLFVDGDFAFSGAFTRHAIAGPNLIAFGDTFIGLSSISDWDYVQVAIVPEPASATLVVLIVGFLANHLRRAK